MRQFTLKIKILFFTVAFVSSVVARGETLLELGATYLSDSIATPTTGTASSYFYNIGVLFSINKTTWGGWNYSSINVSETSPSTEGLSTLDTGPYLKWQFGKGAVFNLSFSYNINSKASYSSGSSTESWEGTSFLISWGVTPEISDGFNVGASINYYSAAYTKKVVGGVESTASNSKTSIYPSIVIIKKF